MMKNCLGGPVADTGAVNVPRVYALDWLQVPAVPPTVPVPVTGDQTCACDLTLRSCDGNCCCDVDDCSEGEIALFTGCLPGGVDPPTLEYCVRDDIIATVNLPSSSGLASVKVQTEDSGFLSALLCITDDNNAALGKFFLDPPAAKPADLSAALLSKDNAYFKADPLPSVVTTTDTFLKVNDSIPAALATSSGDLVAINGGVFRLPAAIFGAECSPVNVIGFMYRDELRSCERSVADLASECAAAYSSAPYLSNLRIGRDRQANPGVSSGYTPVTVASVTYRFAGTGTLLPLTRGLDPTGANIAWAHYDGATRRCRYALDTVAYTVEHNGAGVISSVAADVILTDVVPSSSGAGASSSSSSVVPATLRQSFSVTFVSLGLEETADEGRPISGNPGYINGLPVLAGSLVEEPGEGVKYPLRDYTTAVSRLVTGLPFPGADASGQCAPNAVSPVTFGSNAVSSCIVYLTLAELRAFCNGDGGGSVVVGAPSSNPLLPLQLLPEGFLTEESQTVVGTWANADERNINAWQAITLEDADVNMVWDAATLTCSGVPSGLQYQFLTSRVGLQYNPQRRIALARAAITFSDWRYVATLEDALGGGELGSHPHPFQLTFSARFMPQEQDAPKGVKPRNPPLFKNLPRDIFYPFLTNGAEAHWRKAKTAGMMTLVAAVSLLLLAMAL
eukprot:jgi/Mesvir1/21770/Mv04171-RA.1